MVHVPLHVSDKFRGKVLAGQQAPADLGRLLRIFPSLSRRLDEHHRKLPLAPIGGFTARELVITGPTFQIGRGPAVAAECALIVWYDDDKIARGPQAVEFSFRYGNRKEEYGGGPARRIASTTLGRP